MEQNKNNALSAELIQKKLGNEIEVLYFPAVDSTNSLAKRLVNEGKRNLFLVVANEQINGRGRQGKSFYSPKETGIYMSFVFHPNKELSGVVSSTTVASVAVCKAIENLSDLKPQIKWVNDIYLDDKKICGILCEAINDLENRKVACVIIGIGINITTKNFPSDVENAASLGEGIDRAQLIAEITNQLKEIIAKDFCDFIDYYRSRSMIIGKEIEFIQNSVKTNAKALEIDSNGGLIVELENGEIKTLSSGEISIRKSD